MNQDNTKQARRGARSGVRDEVEAGEPAGMRKTARKRRSRDATLGGMNQHHYPRPAPHPPDTCQERIAKINAAAAVQIARAAAGQPTGWTLLSAVAHWLMARVDVLLEQAS